MRKKCLIAVVGPTASGKSKMATFLAKELAGEIINGDSRQIYRHMDIGTAKPSLEERAVIPQHLYDIVQPDESFNLSEYQKLAYKSIAEISNRGKVPFLVGGSGLYIWSVLEGWKIPSVIPNIKLRQELEKRATEEDTGTLYRELERLDPLVAGRIDPKNLRRIIRALEIFYTRGSSGGPYEKIAPEFSILIIGLRTERKELYRQIDLRVEGMFTEGLVEEVTRLLDMGFSARLTSMSAVGYQEVIEYLEGKRTFEETKERVKFETHRLVRKQNAWFRERDERINWVDTDSNMQERALKIVKGWLAA